MVAGGAPLKMSGLCQPEPRARIHTSPQTHSQELQLGCQLDWKCVFKIHRKKFNALLLYLLLTQGEVCFISRRPSQLIPRWSPTKLTWQSWDKSEKSVHSANQQQSLEMIFLWRCFNLASQKMEVDFGFPSKTLEIKAYRHHHCGWPEKLALECVSVEN